MFFKVLREISRPHWIQMIHHIKRTSGMSVGELSQKMKMSYMGVKQHCIDLEKKGYLDTWRRPKPQGRPEKVYRLTKKANILFPSAGLELTKEIFESVRMLYGPSAPDKLLIAYYNKKAEEYLKKIKTGPLREKAKQFSKMREEEGCCSDLIFDDEEDLRIIEHHNRMEALEKKFPNISKMEENLFSQVLKTPVIRKVESVSGLVQITFYLNSSSKRATS